MSQTAYPKMATIRPRLVRHIDDSVSFSLSAPGMEDIVAWCLQMTWSLLMMSSMESCYGIVHTPFKSLSLLFSY